MVKKVRSARGLEVDFDALKIKEQLAESPAPMEVQAREDFVDQRLKRRARRKAQLAAAALAAKESEQAEESDIPTEDMIEPSTETHTKDPVRKQKTKKKNTVE